MLIIQNCSWDMHLFWPTFVNNRWSCFWRFFVLMGVWFFLLKKQHIVHIIFWPKIRVWCEIGQHWFNGWDARDGYLNTHYIQKLCSNEVSRLKVHDTDISTYTSHSYCCMVTTKAWYVKEKNLWNCYVPSISWCMYYVRNVRFL